MIIDIRKFEEDLAKDLYGMTKSEAHTQGICIQCKQPPRFYSAAGEGEYKISGLCEYCFDEICKEPDGEVE